VTSLLAAVFGCAVCRNHVDVLRVLVEKGRIDVNMVNKQRLTPLHVAVRKGHVDCAQQLVAYSCDINAMVVSLLHVCTQCRFHYSFLQCFVADSWEKEGLVSGL